MEIMQKMPGTKQRDTSQNPDSPEGNSEPEKPTDSDERVDFDGDNDQEETMEEEVEYEEDEVEKKKHAELLALPPHGSEVYIGGIPQNVSEEDLRVFCQSVGEVSEVRIMKGKESGEAKGYAFVTFMTKELASKAIEELNNSEFKVKSVYVKNLPENITQDRLKELFEHHGKITKVVLPSAKSGQEKSRFGFVHFAERSSAMKALKNTEKYEIDGQLLECSLAKPQANSQKPALLPTYPPHLGYGMVGGAIGAGYGAAGFAQPLMYGPGPTPGGMAMMPMMLSDGRIAYIVQGFNSLPQYPDMGGVVAVAPVVGNAVMMIIAIVGMAAIIPTNLMGFKELAKQGIAPEA
ncbi:Heterogeneous nuclear ribonucleoprotein Q [Glycine soja]